MAAVALALRRVAVAQRAVGVAWGQAARSNSRAWCGGSHQAVSRVGQFSLCRILAMQARPFSTGAEFLSPDAAKDLVVKEKAVLLDVREEYEFAEGHAAQAVNISVSELIDRLPVLLGNFALDETISLESAPQKFAIASRAEEVDKLVSGNRDDPIVVYCRSGGRSNMAMELLKREGFSKVYNLGGIIQASQAFDFWGSGSSLGPP